MIVTTYALAYMPGCQTRLCARCEADYSADGAIRIAMGVLGAALHGKHDDDCDGCEIRNTISAAVDDHLLSFGGKVTPDSDADDLVGEDSWQTPTDLDQYFSNAEWRDAARAEIARRVEAARIDGQE